MIILKMVMFAKWLEAAKLAAGTLTSIINRMGWHDKWLRLVLHNIFVQSVMLYAFIVWGSHLVDSWGEWWLDRTSKFGVQEAATCHIGYMQRCTE